MIQTNIYDNKIYFALSWSNQIEEIIEPMNWDKITNHIPRDKRWFGFTSDFIEDKYGLLFTFIKDKEITGGGEILKTIYETKGQGANYPVFFEFGYKRGNTRIQIKKWRINLQDYDCDFGGVSCTIEKMPFQSKLRARFSTTCNINTYSGCDGEILTQIPTWNTRLHSKTLLLQSRALTESPQRSSPYNCVLGGISNLVVQPYTINQPITELSTLFAMPFELINQLGDPSATPAPINIFEDFICQYRSSTSGFLNVEIGASFDFWLWHNDRQLSPAGGEPQWTGKTKIILQRSLYGVPTIVNTYTGATFNINSSSSGFYFGTAPADVLPSVTGGSRDFCNRVPIGWQDLINDIPVEIGDNVYIFYLIEPTTQISDSFIEIQLDNFTDDLKLNQLTNTPSTRANGFRIIDVLNQISENITGQKNCVQSSFFSLGGFGWNYLLINGYGIRNFGGPSYRFKKDLQSLLDDLQAIFCVGIGIKEVYDEFGNQSEKIVIEYVSDFFKTRVIGEYLETFDWHDKNRSDQCFNKIQLGYNKYQGLDISQNDEFCTEGEYLLQSTLINNSTLSKKSNLIASGYLLENQRRNQFIANPQQTLTFDEDIFIVATTDELIYKDNEITLLTVLGVTNFAFFTGSFNLNSGDTFVTSSGANSGTVFTIIQQADGFPRFDTSGNIIDCYYISPVPTTEVSITTDVTILPSSPDQIFCERNEIFEICENVISPSTIYNGRLSLKNILYNWRPVIGVGTFFLDTTSNDYRVTQIVTNIVRMNSIFTHKFLSSEGHKGNIGDITAIENANERIVQYLSAGENIYTPIGCEFKIKIGWNEMDVIRKALCGELNDDTKDFGGIVVKDDFSEVWFVHIDDIQYNLVSQMATILGQKVFRCTV